MSLRLDIQNHELVQSGVVNRAYANLFMAYIVNTRRSSVTVTKSTRCLVITNKYYSSTPHMLCNTACAYGCFSLAFQHWLSLRFHSQLCAERLLSLMYNVLML